MEKEEAENLKRRVDRLRSEADLLDDDAKKASYEHRDYIYEKVRRKHDQANAILKLLAEAGFA